jgi:hypothetical protein
MFSAIPCIDPYQSSCGLSSEITITSEHGYAGNRILEAMRSGGRYGDPIFRELRGAVPEDASTMLDFGAGAGVFLEKFQAIHCRRGRAG